MKELNSQKIQNKLRNKFLKSGVKMIGPETIFFSEDTKIGKNVIIGPYTIVIGSRSQNRKQCNNKFFFTFRRL